jgi:16S rRNA (guanine966-N2)-methyltransferase
MEAASGLGPSPDAEPFGLAFLDPPYGKGLVAPTLEALRDGPWLARDALVIVEEAARAEVVIPEGYASIEARTYADTQVLFLRAE